MDWFDLAVQGTLKSLLQHHSSKASILWHSAFFMVQLSHLHMTTGKNQSFDYTDLCQQSDVSPFLSRFVIACLRAQLCQTLCGPMNCSQLGSSVHGIFQARLLEWVAISYSRKFSWPRVLDVRRVYAPRFFVSSQQRFGVTDIKAPWRVTALGSWTDRVIALK